MFYTALSHTVVTPELTHRSRSEVLFYLLYGSLKDYFSIQFDLLLKCTYAQVLTIQPALITVVLRIQPKVIMFRVTSQQSSFLMAVNVLDSHGIKKCNIPNLIQILTFACFINECLPHVNAQTFHSFADLLTSASLCKRPEKSI